MLAVWLTVAAVQSLAVQPLHAVESAAWATALLLPVALAALVARAAVRRGGTVGRAATFGFLLGAVVGALTPIVVTYASLAVMCGTTGNCL
jgi:hypothetical protein